MCEGPSTISGPIPPDPSLLPQYYKRPASARGCLEGHQRGSLALQLGPLTPDTVLYPESYTACSPSRRPRVSPNATYILERGQKGVVGDLLRLEGLSITPVPKQKQKVHDFSKDNVRRLREIQRRCKEQETERIHAGPVPVKALWTSSKYQNVPSRVSHLPVKPQCQTFLKAHSRGGSSTPPKPSPVTFQRPASSSSTQDLNLMVQGQTIDFVKYNARAARKAALRRSQSLTNLRDKPVPSAVKGQVPQYLEERKKQWQKEEEERKRNAPDPRIPPGHMMLPDSERQETLKSLKDTHGSLVSELLTFPLRSDGLSVRTRRAQLDCKLSEIEEAIKIFSRDRVYVKVDS
ncbi:enkurin domain-containing protein 1 isoform X2 [Poeciliopsis prolifica]|uniref:enkurin domain-containing protein 1 isoform X2 n=1 Tax=Poeciliopsis prolifica TaxID=188132 RepID=UPI002412ECF0|nr:enkurin domain-containing protein 1 isoform X2 [Poeciliopsis prolifica]